VVEAQPHRVVLTAHAVDRAHAYGKAPADVADLVLAHHSERRRNHGRAAWRVEAGGTAVLYDWPDDGDSGRARVVTLWSRG
jgi:hypothetical protein